MSKTSGNKLARLGLPVAAAVLGLVLLLVSLLLVPQVHLSGFRNRDIVSAGDSGFSIYSTQQSDRPTARCSVVANGRTTTFDQPSADFSLEANGTKYWEIGRSPDGLAAAEYQTSCENTQGELFAGNRADRIGGGWRTPVLIVGVLLLIAGIIGALLMFLRDRRAAPPTPVGYDNSGYPYGNSGYPYGQAYGQNYGQNYNQGYQNGYGTPGSYGGSPESPTPPQGFPVRGAQQNHPHPGYPHAYGQQPDDRSEALTQPLNRDDVRAGGVDDPAARAPRPDQAQDGRN